MNSKLCLAALLIALVALAGGCASTGKGPSLYDQLGGKAKADELARGFLDRCTKDPVLTSLVGGKDMEKMVPTLSDGICTTLGGGCTPPRSEDEMRSSAARVNPNQSKALKEHWSATMQQLGVDPTLQEQINKAISDRLGPILATLH